MLVKRSRGGIGSLYRDREFLGKVYYNIAQEQPPGVLTCTLVFMGEDVELPCDDLTPRNGAHRAKQHYRLWLEDGQYLILTLQKLHPTSPSPHVASPYIGSSVDGLFHTTMDFAYSKSDK